MSYKFEKSELSDKLRDDIVFNSDKIAKPAEVEIHGRTLINLLGRAGNPIYGQTNLLNFTPTITSGNFSINVGTDTEYYHILTYNKLEVGKYYVGLFDCISNVNWGAKVQFSNLADWDYKKHDTFENVIGKWHTVYNAVYIPDNESDHANVYFQLGWAKGIKNTVRNIRLYEISKEVYDKINTDEEYTGENLGCKFPYVDDIKCVVNPYIENRENLIDNTRCVRGGTNVYGYINPEPTTSPFIVFQSFIGPGEYTFNIEGFDGSKHFIFTQLPDGTNFNATEYDVRTQATFTKTTSSEFPILLIIGSREDNLTYTEKLYSDIMSGNVKVTLTRGTVAKKYNECHNSRIMFETNLYEGETISRRNDGTYIKNSEWGELSLGSVSPKKIINSATGYKITGRVAILPSEAIGTESYLLKHDGTIVEYLEEASCNSEHWYIHGKTTNEPVFVLSNELTGWGDSYTPTEEEIRAFFLGWRMFIGNTDGELYNGSGTKAWAKIWSGVGTAKRHRTVEVVSGSGTAELPTYLNDQGFTPYRFVYKKKTPTTEEVRFKGSLVIKNEDNIVADSGLIISEAVNSVIRQSNGLSFIHTTDAIALKNRLEYPLCLRNYKDGNFVQFTQGYKNGCNNNHLITNGHAWVQIAENNVADKFLIDYILCRRDSVSSFKYTIFTHDRLLDTINDISNDVVKYAEKINDVETHLNISNSELSEKINPNILINGNFQVWQRGESFTHTHNKYCADRWLMYMTNASSKVTWLKTKNGIRVVCTTANSDGHVRIWQPLEAADRERLIDKKLTYSIRYKTNSNKAFLMAQGAHYKLPKSEKFVTVSFTETFRNLSQWFAGVRFGENNYSMTLDEYIDIEYIKVEIGEHATPSLPRPYSEELTMCQRYYAVISGNFMGYVDDVNTSSGTIQTIFSINQPPMRISPSIRLSDAAIFNVVGNIAIKMSSVSSYTISAGGNFSSTMSIDFSGLAGLIPNVKQYALCSINESRVTSCNLISYVTSIYLDAEIY